jgi:hypothetical protein
LLDFRSQLSNDTDDSKAEQRKGQFYYKKSIHKATNALEEDMVDTVNMASRMLQSTFMSAEASSTDFPSSLMVELVVYGLICC